MSEFHRPKLDPSSPVQFQDSVQWPSGMKCVDEWLKHQPTHEWKKNYDRDGFLIINNLLEEPELKIYQDIYNRMLDGSIDTSRHRHDLGNNELLKKKSPSKENICQIMWPSLYVQGLVEGPAHLRCLAVSKIVLGDDMAHDFDMCISKGPHTNTITPWHCDESYWLDLPDKRALSCWIAMYSTTIDNGCMWFAAGSHKEALRPHRPAAPGVHVLMCDGQESEGEACPVSAGSATCHGGRTLHYSRGNTTDTTRNGFIINYRPVAMVKYEREHDYDHGLRGLHESDLLAAGRTHKSAETE